MDNEFTVTPWETNGKIDYEKLIKKFGTTKLEKDILTKLESKTKSGKNHFFFRRNFIYSHRDFDKMIEGIDKNNFYIYTGRGPSGKMHIGHLIPFIICKWFQDEFGCNVYIALSDDEKFAVKQKLDLNTARKYSLENIEEIAALGFDPDKTFMFIETDFIKQIYKQALEFSKRTTLSTAKAVFGFKNETNMAHLFYPFVQMAPTTLEKNKFCLIPAGIDQDPYWRIQRDNAEKLGFKKVIAIHNKLLSTLHGVGGKMSSSDSDNSTINLDDSFETVKKKINKYAFTGGRPTLEEHRALGGIPEICVIYHYLESLFEEDDSKLKNIYDEYKSGRMTSGEIKNILILKINNYLKKHNENKIKNKPLIEKYMHTGKLAKKMQEM
jgi:tryptophanyl-tRNA synthetase